MGAPYRGGVFGSGAIGRQLHRSALCFAHLSVGVVAVGDDRGESVPHFTGMSVRGVRNDRRQLGEPLTRAVGHTHLYYGPQPVGKRV